MTPPRLAPGLAAWLEAIECGLIRSLELALRCRRYSGWRDRLGRRSGSGRTARVDGRLTMIRLIADIRAIRRWRKELER